jgi:hypothetical protein
MRCVSLFTITTPENISAERKVSVMAENMYTIAGGDTSMGQQYLDTFRRSEHLEPEKALLAAILEDAVHTYRKYAQARDREGKDKFREVEEWLMRSGDDWIFSFKNVCELLGLDPEYVRRGVRETTGARADDRKHGHPHGTRRRAA